VRTLGIALYAWAGLTASLLLIALDAKRCQPQMPLTYVAASMAWPLVGALAAYQLGKGDLPAGECPILRR
jgi:hypothetical protein